MVGHCDDEQNSATPSEAASAISKTTRLPDKRSCSRHNVAGFISDSFLQISSDSVKNNTKGGAVKRIASDMLPNESILSGIHKSRNLRDSNPTTRACGGTR